jgi:hypothetical protein
MVAGEHDAKWTHALQDWRLTSEMDGVMRKVKGGKVLGGKLMSVAAHVTCCAGSCGTAATTAKGTASRSHVKLAVGTALPDAELTCISALFFLSDAMRYREAAFSAVPSQALPAHWRAAQPNLTLLLPIPGIVKNGKKVCVTKVLG